MKIILRLRLQRKREGKDSVFHVRDRIVPSSKIARFSRRRAIRDEDLLEEGIDLASWSSHCDLGQMLTVSSPPNGYPLLYP